MPFDFQYKNKGAAQVDIARATAQENIEKNQQNNSTIQKGMDLIETIIKLFLQK